MKHLLEFCVCVPCENAEGKEGGKKGGWHDDCFSLRERCKGGERLQPKKMPRDPNWHLRMGRKVPVCLLRPPPSSSSFSGFVCYWYRGRAYFENLLRFEVPKACRPCWRYKQFLQVWKDRPCPTYRRPVRFWWQPDADLTKSVRPFFCSIEGTLR